MRTDSAWQILETDTGYAVVGDSYFWPAEYEIWLVAHRELSTSRRLRIVFDALAEAMG